METPEKISPFRMTLSLNVLEHLGINLYSNVPAVLSEVVANAWDADAGNVDILLGSDTITISDNGVGMTQEEVNERFLTVGYRRRDLLPGKTPKGRLPMGRKGIGKLSLFSISDLVEVQTVRNGEKSAFLMSLPAIREHIKRRSGEYLPEAISTSSINFSQGTRIILRSLRRRQTIRTAPALRKRIARRFSIIGPQHGFSVKVNEQEITPSDRDYYGKLQFLWTYGNQAEIEKLCTNISRQSEQRSTERLTGGLTVSGWIGTVKESGDLKDEDGDNLNRVAVYVRGKMAQEDMLASFGERGVYASYLLGELRVDELDLDEEEDAATSSRQNLVEDDPRYISLRDFIGTELKHIQNKWSEWRIDDGVKQALTIPAVTEWLQEIPKEFKNQAKSWIGKINKLRTDDPQERRNLVKHAILAFEFYRANASLEKLDAADEESIDGIVSVFQQLDSLEANLYGQIVQQRIAVIKKLLEYVDTNALEKVVQQFVFNHLWLIDPAWERADAPAMMETRVEGLFEDIEAGLTEEERAARIDIKYRKTAGEHVIIELKRPGRTVGVYELAQQISKYRTGMKKLLDSMGRSDEAVEFVCLLGSYPREWHEAGGVKLVTETLKPLDARVLTYDAMLDNALQSYGDYLKKRQSVDRLGEIIRAIDDYAPAAMSPIETEPV